MMGWRVAFPLLLLCLVTTSRPSRLGAVNRFPFQKKFHRHGHSLDVHPVDDLYGAPVADLYGAPGLSVYAGQELPAYNIPVAESTSKPSQSQVSMMMDPSYNFEYKNADSERTENADSGGLITGSYGFKTAVGNDIFVKYSAGAETGFAVENMEELQAALERSATEPNLLNVKPYTGEIVKVDFIGPKVDPISMIQDSSYMYGYKLSDQAHNQQSDDSGNVKGSYSFTTNDGQNFEVKYSSGVNGFVVENSDEFLSKTNHQSVEYTSKNVPSKYDYVHNEIEAEPYVHEEIKAEPYIHEEVPYVHEEIAAEPYINEKSSSHSGQTAKGYSFSYRNDKSEREEIGDADGFIKGNYKYTNPEGNEISVVYEAGSGIGFVVNNQEDLNASVKKAIEKAAPQTDQAYSASALPLPGYKRDSSGEDNVHPNNNNADNVPSNNIPMDASYMFNSISDEHEFMETSDAAGERTGSYRYNSPEGNNILVMYSAGKDGFVILNPSEVLPQDYLVW